MAKVVSSGACFITIMYLDNMIAFILLIGLKQLFTITTSVGRISIGISGTQPNYMYEPDVGLNSACFNIKLSKSCSKQANGLASPT